MVSFVADTEAVPVEELGKAIRQAAAFLPEGTNVNFVTVDSEDSIELRTYERGVEAETLACGTGAVAAGIVAHLQRGLLFPVVVHVKSGESLRVSGRTEGGKIKSPTLEGSAHMLFRGKLLYNVETRSIVDWSLKQIETA